MIEAGVIVYAFIFAGIISAICFAVFIWINLKDRDLDEKLYSKQKNIRNIVSKHQHKGEVIDESIDSLKKYSVRTESTEVNLDTEEDSLENVELGNSEKLDGSNTELNKAIPSNIISEPKKELTEQEYNEQFKPKK